MDKQLKEIKLESLDYELESIEKEAELSCLLVELKERGL